MEVARYCLNEASAKKNDWLLSAGVSRAYYAVYIKAIEAFIKNGFFDVSEKRADGSLFIHHEKMANKLRKYLKEEKRAKNKEYERARVNYETLRIQRNKADYSKEGITSDNYKVNIEMAQKLLDIIKKYL